jgi:Acetyltransferase (GNAT) domain
MSLPLILQPGEGESVKIKTSTCTFKATGKDTKGQFGLGLATEAAIASRNYGFEELGFNRLISLIDSGNIASQKVALKNGMKYEKDAQMWGKTVRVYTISQE